MPADVARISFAQRAYRQRALEDLTVQTRHPLAVDLEYNTFIRDADDADAFGTYVMGLRKWDRWNYSCLVNADNYPSLAIGMTIKIAYPRFGLSSGRNFIVKRIKKDTNSLFTEIGLFGPEA